MDDPWQILILDANTATGKDVKAAYARLLKQHRPDSDPEGFRRIREAYEAALCAVRERDARGTAQPPYASEPDQSGRTDDVTPPPLHFSPPSFALPEALQATFSEVERAAASGNSEQLEAALHAFHDQCNTSRVEAAVRAGALERACSGNLKLFASAVSDETLLRLAEEGEVHLPHLVISAWEDEERRSRIGQFGRALRDDARALATPEGGMLMARAAVLVGLEKPLLASTLGNLAYPHLPVDSRTQIMEQLERETALGKLFHGVSADMKPFWFERLRHPGESHDWRQSSSMRALDDLVERQRHLWQGWGILQQLLPQEQWAQVENRLRNQAQESGQSPAPAKVPIWAVFVAVIVVINFLRMAVETSNAPNYARENDVPNSDEWSRSQEQRLKNELFRRNALESWNRSRTQRSGAPPNPVGPSVLDPPKDMSTLLNQPIPKPGILEPPLVIPIPGSQQVLQLPHPVVPGPKSDDQKSKDEYLRAIQDGSLFEGSNRMRPAQ